MIRIVGVGRTDHANFVDQPRGEGEQFADRYATFPGRLKAKGGWKDAGRRSFGPEVGSCGALASIFFEVHFWIEGVSLVRSPIHKEVDHAFGSGPKVRRLLSGPGAVGKGRVHPQCSSPTGELSDERATIHSERWLHDRSYRMKEGVT